MILVIQFRAWLPAILILLAAPLSLGGALLLLLAHRHRPEHLVGDGADPARRSGREERHHAARLLREAARARASRSKSAIAHAGRIRLRPILMTTFCTLFGLLPLALGLGAGAELQKPLALAVIVYTLWRFSLPYSSSTRMCRSCSRRAGLAQQRFRDFLRKIAEVERPAAALSASLCR